MIELMASLFSELLNVLL